MTACNQVPVSGQPLSILPVEPYCPAAFSTVAKCHEFYNCNMQLKIDDFNLSRTVLLDSGANVCLIASNILPDHINAKFKSISTQTIQGVTGSGQIIGSFICSIQTSSIQMDNIQFLIIDRFNVDIIVGLPILDHHTVSQWGFNKIKKTMFMHRYVNGAEIIQETVYPRV